MKTPQKPNKTKVKSMSTRTARRWRAAGVNPRSKKSVRDRLLEAHNIPENAIGGIVDTSPAPSTGPTGPAAQAARLEQDVRHLRHRLKLAEDSNDPVLARAIRRQLLASEDQLRKLFESGATTDGDTIPRADVERLLQRFGWLLAATATAQAISIGSSIAPERQDVISPLANGLKNWISRAALASSAAQPLPQWARDAFSKGADTGLTEDPERDAMLAKLFGELFTCTTEQAMRDVLDKAGK